MAKSGYFFYYVVIIRTKGDQCELTVNAPHDDVNFYGFSKAINVVAVADNSMHIFGSTAKLTVVAGHVEIEDTGIVFELADNTGSVKNNGYIGQQTSGTPVEGTVAGGNYAINSLARLEAFRDAVNSGNNFAGKTVELKENLTLKDGWTPIGEGTRKVVGNATNVSHQYTGTAFAGKFDGGNHTISNLNNKGFVPTLGRVGSGIYAYGLFALVQTGAEISNLTIKGVDIDTTRTADANIDSVGALVGFSAGSLTVKNVKVENATIKAVDAVSGLVGRAYKQDGLNDVIDEVTIQNCVVSATLTGIDESGSKAAGILGYVQLRHNGSSSDKSVAGIVTIKDCTATIETSHFEYSANLFLKGDQVRIGEGGAEGNTLN